MNLKDKTIIVVCCLFLGTVSIYNYWSTKEIQPKDKYTGTYKNFEVLRTGYKGSGQAWVIIDDRKFNIFYELYIKSEKSADFNKLESGQIVSALYGPENNLIALYDEDYNYILSEDYDSIINTNSNVGLIIGLVSIFTALIVLFK
ncbi:hypothetical protein [Gilvibacter sp.]|uniref:hypothetical protein n=1 Tax=Gilvibacter sp. TaxID=2729997 RepID=UPI003F4A4BB6